VGKTKKLSQDFPEDIFFYNKPEDEAAFFESLRETVTENNNTEGDVWN